MAKTIRLAAGGYVTRAWDGESFRFEVDVTRDGGCDGYSLRPTPQEMLDIGALFRRAGLKMRTRAKKEYEAPTLNFLGNVRDECRRCPHPLGEHLEKDMAEGFMADRCRVEGCKCLMYKPTDAVLLRALKP